MDLARMNRQDRLAQTVVQTLSGVFQRPRFGFKVIVDPLYKAALIVEHDGYNYHLLVTVFSQVDIAMTGLNSGNPDLFYRTRFPAHKLENLRKIGITISNKVVNRVIHEVMKE